ncbi:MAG: signal protein [Methylophaga sp.]|nr:MAG: signal protein [Methylophaga sp.]
MSLSKQLLILITFIFLIVFSVNFVLSMNNIRSYLEVESRVHAQDTATSLGLSLSPHMVDEQDPILRTMMNAIFDKGYFKEMRLINVDGEDLVRLTHSQKIQGVPSWLISLMPIEAATAVSEISSGWNISGTIYVTSNPGNGYIKLYEQGKAALKFALIIFVGALILLILVLRFTLQSLKEIEVQANEISSGNFTIIHDMPWTLEVKSVAYSMNSMSRKIGGMISRLNNKLEALSESLKHDTLTNLFNQATFKTHLKRALTSGKSNHAFFIKFDDLSWIAKDKGSKVVDELLVDFASLLLEAHPDVTAYRLYGAEFSLLCPGLNNVSLTALADTLQQEITTLGDRYDISDLVHIGIVQFDRTSEFNKLSPAMLEAYEQARNIGSNAYFIQQDIIRSMNEQDWKAAITYAIENNTPEITFTTQAYRYDEDKAEKVMEEAFTIIKDKHGADLSTATFFSIAQEFGLAEALDKCIVNKIIIIMEQAHRTTPVTLNLSMGSAMSSTFMSWLQTRIERSNVSPQLLVFSVTAYAASKNVNAFALFSKFVKSIGASALIKRYSPDIIAIDLLKDMNIDYIRLARDLTTDIQGNSSKPDCLEIIHEVSNLLDIKVLAEGVSDDADFNVVKNSGLYGISR